MGTTRQRQTRFLRILRVELEDLEQHIEERVTECLDRQRKHQLSERVCFENVAVLKSEEFGIEHFLRIVDALDPDDFEDLASLIEELRRQFREQLKKTGLAEAAYFVADLKIASVATYVQPDRC